MSLMGTLAKVAIGVAVAKGVGSMMQRKGEGSFGAPGGSGGRGGGLEDIMGDILGGRSAGRASTSRGDGSIFGGGSGGGLGDLMEELGDYAPDHAEAPRRTPGGLDDLIGGLGRSGGGQGGLGDLLGGILGGLAGGAAGGTGRGGTFGEVLNDSLGNCGEPGIKPTPDQDAVAGLMLRAMIQAAKSDGRVDAEEQRKLMGNLGDVSPQERQFVEAELRAPVDVRGLARQVPRGLEAQVYTMAVMAIDVDNRNEANYLHELASAMNIDRRQVNHIHARLGVPALYS